eukprot:Skav211625  [mRNA]  locus=scaffold1088:96843:128265:- [translate_table: standard]
MVLCHFGRSPRYLRPCPPKAHTSSTYPPQQLHEEGWQNHPAPATAVHRGAAYACLPTSTASSSQSPCVQRRRAAHAAWSAGRIEGLPNVPRPPDDLDGPSDTHVHPDSRALYHFPGIPASPAPDQSPPVSSSTMISQRRPPWWSSLGHPGVRAAAPPKSPATDYPPRRSPPAPGAVARAMARASCDTRSCRARARRAFVG